MPENNGAYVYVCACTVYNACMCVYVCACTVYIFYDQLVAVAAAAA